MPAQWIATTDAGYWSNVENAPVDLYIATTRIGRSAKHNVVAYRRA